MVAASLASDIALELIHLYVYVYAYKGVDHSSPECIANRTLTHL